VNLVLAKNFWKSRRTMEGTFRSSLCCGVHGAERKMVDKRGARGAKKEYTWGMHRNVNPCSLV